MSKSIKEIDKSLYFNLNEILSYNRIFNFIIGVRGVGKTYSSKIYTTNRFIKKEEQFIYLKRYKTDIINPNKFLDSIRSEFKNEMNMHNRNVKIDNKDAGILLPLSSWQSVKSNEYPNVTTIVFDEFLLEKSSKQIYMENEVEAFLNFVDTVVRNRDNLRVIFLANSVSMVNPYFLYFKITPDINKRFNVYEDIIVQIENNRDFAEERKKTRFGRLISNTPYGDFALSNKFKDDRQIFIEKRTKQSKFKFSIVYNGITLGVWLDTFNGNIYLAGEHDPYTKYKYALTVNDMNDDLILVTKWRSNYHLIKLVEAFKNNYLRFDNQIIRNVGYDMFNKLNIF